MSLFNVRINACVLRLTACCGLFAATATVAAVPDAVQPPTLHVGVSSNCQYHTLADVIAATPSAGWQIQVEGNLTDQHATIANKNLAILPGLCPNSTGTVPTQVTISGAGSTNAPVLTITGTSSVHLIGLVISGGHSGGIDGGGISYNGSGILTLTTVTVSGNTANYGGGINFKGNGGAAELHINHDTIISANIATVSGGGIRVEGTATLFMLAPNSTVAFNHADGGYGGGIEVIGPAQANIGSPGDGVAAIFSNQAARGGGIAAVSGLGDYDGSVLRLFTTDAFNPVRVEGNAATVNGGGIYASPSSQGAGEICLFNFRIDSNYAKEGAALYANTFNDFGENDVNMNDSYNCDVSQFASVACDPSVACNTIHGNVAEDVSNGYTPTTGAALLLQSGNHFRAHQIDVRGNHGGYALRVVGNTSTPAFYTTASLSNCIFADNAVTAQLILSSSGTVHLNLSNCTLAHDQIGGSHVIYAEDTFSLNDSIIDEPGIPALQFSGSASGLGGLHNLANDPSGLAGGPTIVTGEPTFVDAANGDYRLNVVRQGGTVFASLGVDYAPAVTGDDRDIRTLPFDQDVPSVANRFGVRDLGAYEMQPYPDRIFVDSFGDPVRLAY